MSLPYLPTSLLLLLASLAIPPRPSLAILNPTTLKWPLDLLIHAPKSLNHLPPTTVRTLNISRAVEAYVLAYFLLGFMDATVRLAGRARARYTGNTSYQYKGLETRRILGVRPILKGLAWHMMAWRLVTLPTVPGGLGTALGAAKSAGVGWDVPTFVGVMGGLVACGEEFRGLLGLFGWGKDPQSGPSWTLSITHVVLCAHRLLLAIRLLSSGIATSGSIKA